MIPRLAIGVTSLLLWSVCFYIGCKTKTETQIIREAESLKRIEKIEPFIVNSTQRIVSLNVSDFSSWLKQMKGKIKVVSMSSYNSGGYTRSYWVLYEE